MSQTEEQRISQAVSEFGEEIVSVAIEMVKMADPDGAYSIFEDNGMYEHAEAVSLIYFDF